MKKRLVSIFIVVLAVNYANGQITKGNWMVGGSASLVHTNYNSTGTVKYSTTFLLIAPKIGYFIWDKFSAGAVLSASFIKNSYPSNPSSGTISYSNKSQSYNIGPFVRYYLLHAERETNLFLEGSYQFQLRKDITASADSRQSANIMVLSGGVVLYLNSSVGVEFAVGYSSLRYNNFSESSNSLQTGIGLQIHLQKDH